jgi:hypothetical protein
VVPFDSGLRYPPHFVANLLVPSNVHRTTIGMADIPGMDMIHAFKGALLIADPGDFLPVVGWRCP